MSTTCNCETPELEKSGLVVVQPKASTSTWAIDRVHSTAQFKVKHMMISNVLGEFASITGVLERDENDISKSKIRASIDADTIHSGASTRCAPEERGFLPRREASGLNLRLDGHIKERRWGAEGQRRPDDPRSDPKRGF